MNGQHTVGSIDLLSSLLLFHYFIKFAADQFANSIECARTEDANPTM